MKVPPPLKHTAEEEQQFILQAAFAPVTIIKRVLRGESLGRALILSIDRDAFLTDLRAQRKRAEKAVVPTP